MNKSFKITCEDEGSFTDTCARLVYKGVHFEAFQKDFTIYCTGGF